MATPTPPPRLVSQPSRDLGGFIFLCDRFTMQDCLKRQLFGMSYCYLGSVRAIRPGMPIFLYNTSSGFLHGIFEATSYGGLNLDPTVWPDVMHPGRSRYPAQVRIRWMRRRLPIPERVFKHAVSYDAVNRFRRVLTVPEARNLMELFDVNWRIYLRLSCRGARFYHYI